MGGELGGVMYSTSTFLIYSRLLARYFKTTWTFFLLFRIFDTSATWEYSAGFGHRQLPLDVDVCLHQIPNFQGQPADNRVQNFRRFTNTPVLSSSGSFYPRVWSIQPKGGVFDHSWIFLGKMMSFRDVQIVMHTAHRTLEKEYFRRGPCFFLLSYCLAPNPSPGSLHEQGVIAEGKEVRANEDDIRKAWVFSA